MINGFWINQTGDLEIVIRYKPQDWFEIGLVISGLTFVLRIFSSTTGEERKEINGLKSWRRRLKTGLQGFQKYSSLSKRRIYNGERSTGFTLSSSAIYLTIPLENTP